MVKTISTCIKKVASGYNGGAVILEVKNFSGGVKTTRSHGFGEIGQQI